MPTKERDTDANRSHFSYSKLTLAFLAAMIIRVSLVTKVRIALALLSAYFAAQNFATEKKFERFD